LIKVMLSASLWGGAAGGLLAQDVWRDSRRPLSDLVTLRDEKETLPPTRWMGRDQRTVARETARIQDRLLEVLEHSELTRQRDAYHAAAARQEGLRLQLRELRELRVSAPDLRGSHQVFTKTKVQYDEDIARVESQMQALERERRERVQAMREEYAKMGIELKEEQVLFFLSSVSGDDLIAMSALFHHTRAINQHLEDLIRANPGDLDSARRYYGVHVVLLETMQTAHEQMVAKIDGRYLGNLSSLAEENRRLMGETEGLLSRSTGEQREQLLRNRSLQELTAGTLVLYRQHLEQVRRQVSLRLEQLKLRHEIAANSHATLRLSSALAAEIEQLIRELYTLQGMHLPELLPFENEVFEEKFRAITRELEAAR